MTEAFNHLLYWLSAQGDSTYEQFQYLCQQLKFGIQAHQVRRHLQLLCHIEVPPGAKHWGIAPAACVQIPDTDTWFMVGQRSIQLAQWQGLERIPHPEGPDCLKGHGDIPQIPGLAIEWAGCVADNLLQRLLPINQWIDELVAIPLLHPLSEYFIERWDADREQFLPKGRDDFQRGIYQFKRRAGRYETEIRLYYHDERREFLVADFTGLRCIQRYDKGLPLEAIFDRKTRQLWVPENQRWPYIYERCIVLASGQLPIKSPLPGHTKPWLCYQHVPLRFMKRYTRELLDIHIEVLR